MGTTMHTDVINSSNNLPVTTYKNSADNSGQEVSAAGSAEGPGAESEEDSGSGASALPAGDTSPSAPTTMSSGQQPTSPESSSDHASSLSGALGSSVHVPAVAPVAAPASTRPHT